MNGKERDRLVEALKTPAKECGFNTDNDNDTLYDYIKIRYHELEKDKKLNDKDKININNKVESFYNL